MSTTIHDDKLQWDRLLRDLKELGSLEVTVGVHDDTGLHTAEDGEPAESVAQIAAKHEFGAGKIPERSFLRRTFDKKESAIRGEVEDAIGDVIMERQTPVNAMEAVGIEVRGMVQKVMLAGIDPPLSATTLAARDAKASHGGGLLSFAGRHTPLIDSGQLFTSVQTKVGRRGRKS